ncbi:hypothetical protein GQX74_009195 [Glossina fuscipes]|uniref:Uncharacterized protein n=1 Tax=Glossina palpalis gambiensis TaxID=67801 RepID=A0A1B0AQ31_9MUSC|nr:hypothetical protein GQX74_009195 [Glossina fuscipes]
MNPDIFGYMLHIWKTDLPSVSPSASVNSIRLVGLTARVTRPSNIEPGNRNISLRCITYSCRVWVCVVFGVSSTTTKFTGRLTRGEISEVVITTPSSNTVKYFAYSLSSI